MRRARMHDVFSTHRVEMFDHDVELGFVYEQGAIVPDGTTAPERDPWGSEYRPTTRPGHRLPHAWLEVKGARVSTHDLLDDHASFLLIANAEGGAWCQAARAIAQERGLRLRAVRVAADGDALDTDRSWATLSDIGAAGAVLVRPDGMIAWRCAATPTDAPQQLRTAFHQLLGPKAG